VWYNSHGKVASGSATSAVPGLLEKYRALEDGLGRFSLQLSSIELTDQGEWKCVVASPDGAKAMSCATLNVIGIFSTFNFSAVNLQTEFSFCSTKELQKTEVFGST
jgi:hypothetical protein